MAKLVRFPRSASQVLPGDRAADFAAILRELEVTFQPADLLAQRCVREMAEAEWRLLHMREYASLAIQNRMASIRNYHEEATPFELQQLAFDELVAGGTGFRQYLAYETKYERQFERAWQLLERRQKQQSPPAPAKRGSALRHSEPEQQPDGAGQQNLGPVAHQEVQRDPVPRGRRDAVGCGFGRGDAERPRQPRAHMRGKPPQRAHQLLTPVAIRNQNRRRIQAVGRGLQLLAQRRRHVVHRPVDFRLVAHGGENRRGLDRVPVHIDTWRARRLQRGAATGAGPPANSKVA